MSHKRNEALRHVQHSMHHVIAAGEGSDRAPDSCKLCPYYRPDFKFRTCLYAHCPYKKQVNVFRSTPEKWDILYARKKSRQEPQTLITSMDSPASCSPSTGFPSCCFRIAASNRFPQMPKPCTVSCWTA